MNELELLFKLSNVDYPSWLHQYNLLVEAEAYFICKDQVKKLGNGVHNLDYSNDIGNRIPLTSDIYGYELYSTPEMSFKNRPKEFIKITTSNIYINPISNVTITLNDFINSYMENIKEKIKDNESKTKIFNEYISFFQRKANKIHEYLTKIKRKYQNTNEEIPSNQKAELLNYIEYYKSYLILINLLSNKSFSFNDIKKHKACIMEATILDNYYYLNLEKTFEDQPDNIKKKLEDNYVTSGYKFIKSTSFNGLSGKQIYDLIKNEFIEEGYTKNPARLTSISLNSNKIYGTYEPSLGRYTIFDPTHIWNIKIIKTFD